MTTACANNYDVVVSRSATPVSLSPVAAGSYRAVWPAAASLHEHCTVLQQQNTSFFHNWTRWLHWMSYLKMGPWPLITSLSGVIRYCS